MSKRRPPNGGDKSARRSNSAKRAPASTAEETIAPELADVVGYLIRRAYNLSQLTWSMRLQEQHWSVTSVQAGMLMVIRANPSLTQAALARTMNVEGPTLLQSIDRLVEKGYVQRERRTDDRRKYALSLTEAGAEICAEIDAFAHAHDEALVEALSPAERRTLIALLTRVVLTSAPEIETPKPPKRPSSRRSNRR